MIDLLLALLIGIPAATWLYLYVIEPWLNGRTDR